MREAGAGLFCGDGITRIGIFFSDRTPCQNAVAASAGLDDRLIASPGECGRPVEGGAPAGIKVERVLYVGQVADVGAAVGGLLRRRAAPVGK